MSQGFLSRNSALITQIDGTNKNFLLEESGVFSAGPSSGSAVPATWVQSTFWKNRRFFLRPSSYGVNFAIKSIDNGNGTSSEVFWASSPITVSYKIFIKSSNLIGKKGFGLEVYTESGELCYSSSYKSLTIAAALTIPIQTNTNHTFSLPSYSIGKIYAETNALLIIQFYQFGNPVVVNLVYCKFNSETSVTYYTDTIPPDPNFTVFRTFIGVF